MLTYNKRAWLNKHKSSSTGSIVCFSGYSNYSFAGETIPAYSRFVEISDCHGKVRIHQARFETIKEYKDKIKKLHKELGKYLARLDTEGQDDIQSR